MRRERQIQLLERVAAAGPDLRGLHADASVTRRASAYTDPIRFADEMRILFRRGPVLVGLSSELSDPGSYRAIRVDGIPIVVVRQRDGSLRALVNMCRHRGAALVDPIGDGEALKQLACPYHAWTYELDGSLRARPGAAGAFDDVTADCSLRVLPAAEAYGLIFVRPEGDEAIDVDATLSGVNDDLESFGLADYVPIASKTHTWNINWKLFFDTFTESYHIRTLHRNSIAPMFNSDTVISEVHGRNVLSIGLRKNVLEEIEKPRQEWSLLPYGTIQYFLVPNGLVVHQLDHVEVWRVDPVDVDETAVTATVFAPVAPESDRQRRYFEKNLELLLNVTGSEDFPLMEQIQSNLASGALDELIYGRNEPPLIYFHRIVDEALAEAGCPVD